MFQSNQVVNLIDSWFPEEWYGRERYFEKDLAGYLRNNWNERIGGERPSMRTQSRTQKVDIKIGDDIGVELKRALTTSKRDRLVGQIERYPFSLIIVVVCGVRDENAWEELRDLESKYRNDFQKDVIIIRKDKGGRKQSRNEKELNAFDII